MLTLRYVGYTNISSGNFIGEVYTIRHMQRFVCMPTESVVQKALYYWEKWEDLCSCLALPTLNSEKK